MKRRYTLDAKINALNHIDQNDGDLQGAAKELKISAKTLEKWRAAEESLRAQYRARQTRHLERLQFDLQIKMIERCHAILAQMHEKPWLRPPSPNSIPPSRLCSNMSISYKKHRPKMKEYKMKPSDSNTTTTIKFKRFHPGQAQVMENPARFKVVTCGRRWGRPNWDCKASYTPRWRRTTLLVAGADKKDGKSSLARLEARYQALERDLHRRN